MYRVRPSEIVGITDLYTSFCFDEACAYIISKMKDGEEPDFTVKDDKEGLEKPHYGSLKEMYNSMGFGYGNCTKPLNS